MNSNTFIDSLLSLPVMAEPMVSRDHKWLAWTWFRAGPSADVFVAPSDNSSNPLRMTNTKENTLLVSWTPDSRHLIVEQDVGGNERSQLFLLDLDQPLSMLPLTEAHPNYYIRGGELHPNGQSLFYGANYDVTSGREIEATWIYQHDLKTGERTPLAKPLHAGTDAPKLNSSGSHLLYTRKDRHPSGQQVWLIDIEQKCDREILNFGSDVKTFASWLPDGKRVLVLTEHKTYRRLGVYDIDTGAISWILDDPRRNIEDAFVPHGSDRIVVVQIQQARIRSSLLSISGDELFDLPHDQGNLIPIAPVNGVEWVGLYFSAQHPRDTVLFSPQNIDPIAFKSLSRVWDRTSLKPDMLFSPESIEWKSVDGLRIQGWLYRTNRKRRGTIVYVHGGPTMHSQDQINAQIQLFVYEGFNVLDPNYRGSTGFDLGFQEAIKQTGWGGLEQEDIRTGIEALISRGEAQPGHIGITGTSYGGYSAWCAITRYSPSIIAAAAPICGMTDLVVDYKTTRPDLRPYSEEMMGGSPTQVPSLYFERSPINYVRNIHGGLLIVLGLRDPNVTPENVHSVKVALKEAGIPFEILSFEDEGHGISRPKNQKRLYSKLVEFFAYCLGGGCDCNHPGSATTVPRG